MVTDIQEQAIKVTWKTTEITAIALKSMIVTLLENRGRTQQGEQKLSKLNLQNKQLESVELSKEDIKSLRRNLNKFSVDFSIMKDRNNEKFIVFFKEQDVDRIYQGLENCIKGFDRTIAKKPIKDVLKQAEKQSAEREAKNKKTEKEHTAERGKEER